jgi:hypothetical protein
VIEFNNALRCEIVVKKRPCNSSKQSHLTTMEKMILVPYENYQRLLEKEIMDEGVSKPPAIIKKPWPVVKRRLLVVRFG